jgi:hypothetical protein
MRGGVNRIMYKGRAGKDEYGRKYAFGDWKG